MTDEARETLNEENQTTLEQADLPPEDAPTSEQTPQDVLDGESEEGESSPEPVGSIDQEPVQEGESANEGESTLEQADTQIEEGQTPEEEQGFGQEGEISTDASETTEETDEAGKEGETTAQMEEPAVQEPEQAPTVESVIEAILFATDESLTDGRLASIVETTAKQVRASIESLNAKYEANNSAFRIEQIAGGYQMLTLGTYNHWLKKLVHVRSETKLSPAALETLAIIAYKQPIIRADIEAIRGVAVGEVIRSLMYKGLVKIVGRAEILGRPMLYGTTKKFLEVFGLNSLKDLPKAEDLKNPDRQ